MPKTTKTTETKKPIYVEPIVEITILSKPEDLALAGWKFRWQNLHHRIKVGWGMWRPVTKDSELGEFVAEQFGIILDKHAGVNATSNYFMQGSDGVLAYTSEKALADRDANKDVLADQALRAVGKDIEITRHVQIDAGPFKGKKG